MTSINYNSQLKKHMQSALLNPYFHTYEFVTRVKISYEFITHVWQLRADMSHICENFVLDLIPPPEAETYKSNKIY